MLYLCDHKSVQRIVKKMINEDEIKRGVRKRKQLKRKCISQTPIWTCKKPDHILAWSRANPSRMWQEKKEKKKTGSDRQESNQIKEFCEWVPLFHQDLINNGEKLGQHGWVTRQLNSVQSKGNNEWMDLHIIGSVWHGLTVVWKIIHSGQREA